MAVGVRGALTFHVCTIPLPAPNSKNCTRAVHERVEVRRVEDALLRLACFLLFQLSVLCGLCVRSFFFFFSQFAFEFPVHVQRGQGGEVIQVPPSPRLRWASGWSSFCLPGYRLLTTDYFCLDQGPIITRPLGFRGHTGFQVCPGACPINLCFTLKCLADWANARSAVSSTAALPAAAAK
jgi:hypothetical protein